MGLGVSQDANGEWNYPVWKPGYSSALRFDPVPHYSTDIAATWEVNEKAGPYVLIPVGIYNNYDDWNEPGRSKNPDYFAWIALSWQSSIPKETEDNYIDWIEEQLTTDMLAETPMLAICRRALLDKMEA